MKEPIQAEDHKDKAEEIASNRGSEFQGESFQSTENDGGYQLGPDDSKYDFQAARRVKKLRSFLSSRQYTHKATSVAYITSVV